jgi:hypothetical protein
MAAATLVRALVGVQATVKLKVNELSEARWTVATGEGLLAAVQALVRLQVARARETLPTHGALVRSLARVYQSVNRNNKKQHVYCQLYSSCTTYVHS